MTGNRKLASVIAAILGIVLVAALSPVLGTAEPVALSAVGLIAALGGVRALQEEF